MSQHVTSHRATHRVALLTLLIPSIILLLAAAAHERYGRFLDELTVLLLDEGRKVKLLKDYRYEDPAKDIWKANKDFVSDGASIPRPLWPIIGSPLTGRYRNAAIIHDYYCSIKSRAWRDTHRAFFFAMRANGVSAVHARTMYYAVLAYGPRWVVLQNRLIHFTVTITQEDLQHLRAAIAQLGVNPSLEALESAAIRLTAERYPEGLRR
jgi:hypothetical protein